MEISYDAISNNNNNNAACSPPPEKESTVTPLASSSSSISSQEEEDHGPPPLSITTQDEVHDEDEDDDDDAPLFSSRSPSNGSSSLFPAGSTGAVIHYFQRLAQVYSPKYLVFLGLIKVLICGVFAGLIGSSFLPVFQRVLGVDAATEQVLVLVCTLPYTANPLLGVVSDLIPLGGYHKKYWMVLAIAFGVMGSATLQYIITTTTLSSSSSSSTTNTVPAATTSTTTFVVLGLVAMNLQLAVLNLLNEGKYSEIMRQHPETGADVVTFTQACAALGSLVAMSFVGPLSDSGNLSSIFAIASLLGLSPLIPTLLNWLPETKRDPGENGLLRLGDCCCGGCADSSGGSSLIMLDIDRLRKQKRILGIAILVGVGGPTLAVVSAFVSRSIGILVVALLLLLVGALSYLLLPRSIASIVAYTIVTKLSTPSLRSALQYFYTANEACLPDGPHFSYTYYITINGIVGEVFMLLAIVIYQTFMSTWSYRSVLLSTLLLDGGGRLVDVVLVNRWNLVIGIPDHVFFLLGSSMLESVTSMLHLLPFSAIVSKVCPSGTETATFAFVAGVSSFSSTFSSLAGAALMDFAGLKTTVKASSAESSPSSCNFDALPMLIFVMAIMVPIAVGIPAIFTLIPERLQSEAILENEDDGEVQMENRHHHEHHVLRDTNDEDEQEEFDVVQEQADECTSSSREIV